MLFTVYTWRVTHIHICNYNFTHHESSSWNVCLAKLAIKYNPMFDASRMQGIVRYTEIIRNNSYLRRNHNKNSIHAEDVTFAQRHRVRWQLYLAGFATAVVERALILSREGVTHGGDDVRGGWKWDIYRADLPPNGRDEFCVATSAQGCNDADAGVHGNPEPRTPHPISIRLEGWGCVYSYSAARSIPTDGRRIITSRVSICISRCLFYFRFPSRVQRHATSTSEFHPRPPRLKSCLRAAIDPRFQVSRR